MSDPDSDALSRLLSSAGLVLVGALLASAGKLIERVIIGRSLSPDAYGEVNIGLAVLWFGFTLSMIGFNQGIPRYISRFDSDRDVRGTWLTGLVVAGLMALVVAVGLFASVDLLATHVLERAESPGLLRLFALAIPLVVGLQVGIGAIRGLENTIYKTYTRDLLYPGLRIVLLVVFLELGFDIMAAGYAYLGAAAVTFVVVHLLVNRLFRLVGPVRTHARELVKFSAPLVVSTLLGVLLTRTDTLMVGYFRPSFEVGLYSAAYPVANGMLVILSSFGYLYLPLASRIDAERERDEVEAIYRITTKWIFVLTFPAFLVFVAFPGDVLSIFFTEEYRGGGIALAILAVGFFTSASAGRNRETLSALGYTTYVLLSNAIAFGLNVTLNLLLIPVYGFVGAAVASAASFVTLNVVVYVILQGKFDISPFSNYTSRTFVVVPAALLPVGFLLSQWISLSVVSMAAMLVGTGLATLAVVMLTGCLQAEDEVVVEFFEERIGVSIPVVRRYIPAS